MTYNTEKIRHAYKSRYNLERENQVIFLMITDGKKWHYFAVKKLSAPLRGITSKHEGDFYCLNCSQFALTVALNYQNIKNYSERISKIRPFIDQYN